MIKSGMMLAQVKAARLPAISVAKNGKTTGPWTTDMFVEAGRITALAAEAGSRQQAVRSYVFADSRQLPAASPKETRS